jgi:outer membrane lipoprotein-sorting protein
MRTDIMNTSRYWSGLTLALLITGAAVGLAILANKAHAGAAEDQKGLAIAQEIDRRDLGFGDSKTEMEMILTNRTGESSTRKLRLETLEVPDSEAGDKSLTIFDHPRDIKGTAFLSFTKILEPDDQWLYLPALKRVKRISSANKSGPFVGSEFAYEDLTSFEVAKYSYTWLRDEPCGEMECSVIERVPQYERSGYSKQIAWVDTAEYRIVKVDFYDRKDSLLKTLNSTEWQKYLDQYWRPHRMHMVNHQTGKETILTFQPYQFREGVNEANFNQSRLARLR